MALKESQDAIKEYGRPEYEGWLKEVPHTQSLPPKAQVEAFRIRDQQVGAQKTKEVKHDFSELRLDGVTRRFAGSGAAAFAALSDLTMTIRSGEFVALIG